MKTFHVETLLENAVNSSFPGFISPVLVFTANIFDRAEKVNDVVVMTGATVARGLHANWGGQFPEARSCYEEALSIAETSEFEIAEKIRTAIDSLS